MTRYASRRLAAAAWALAGAGLLAEVVYPLAGRDARAPLSIAAVVVFFGAALLHCLRYRGTTGLVQLALVAGVGGLLADVLGVHTGFPFGRYHYTGALGPRVLDVPWLIGAAWTMMLYPAWTVARYLTTRPAARIVVGSWALTSWDVFLDPQMVHAGLWSWQSGPGLPGVAEVPLTNYLGWFVVALAMTSVLETLAQRSSSRPEPAATALPVAVYLWTYGSSVLAHATFFALPASAAWGAVAMGAVAIPLVRRLWRGAGPTVTGLPRPVRAQ